MTDQTQQTGHDTEAAGRIRAYLEIWEGDAFYRDPIDLLGGRKLHGTDLRTVLAALDSAQKQVADLTAENDRLFIDYSTEKTRREQFGEAFDEVRADRDRLAKERAGWRSIAGADEVEAERDAAVARATRLAERVDQLETLLGQILARFDTKGQPGYAAIRTAWIRAELVAMWRKVAKGSDAGKSGDETEATEAEATAEPMSLGEAFETLRELPGFASWRADATTPTCSPTPNALICACGAPINHEGARP